MRSSNLPWAREIACCLMLLMTAEVAEAAGQSSQDSVASQEIQGTPLLSGQNVTPSGESKDASAPDASLSPSDPDAKKAEPSQSAGSNGASSVANSSSDQQQISPVQAVGTAAAPASNTRGIAASRMTGAVVAPAKQHRARTILIRVGLLAGAGVAIGAVVALSHSSPSQPKVTR